jgi:hypothetical protein
MKDLKLHLKLSRKSWLTIIVGAVIIAVASLSLNYYQQVQRYNQINAQFVQTQKSLEKTQIPKLLSSKSELEAELSEKTLQLENTQARLSIPIASSIITKTLFDVADNHRLEVGEMTSSSPHTETLEGIKLSQTELTARVEGNLSDIIHFIIDLNKRFNTSVIRSVTVDVPKDSSEENSSMVFKMDIYTIER